MQDCRVWVCRFNVTRGKGEAYYPFEVLVLTSPPGVLIVAPGALILSEQNMKKQTLITQNNGKQPRILRASFRARAEPRVIATKEKPSRSPGSH